MNTPPLLPGKPAYWLHVPLRRQRSYRYGYRYDALVLVVAVHPKTAHIRVRRYDGREHMRWVKLSNLRGVQWV